MSKIFPILILLTALLISFTSGYYSVIGLTRLFAGAVLEVAILGIVLEIAKIIITTSIHRYWNTLNNFLKAYLISAIIILMLITSAGIYGFLSSAYQDTIIADSNSTKISNNLDSKLDRLNTIQTDLTKEYSEITNNITQLRLDLKGDVNIDVHYKDAIRLRDKISNKIDGINDSIVKYEFEKSNLLTSNSGAHELSSLKYISQLTGIEMARILNYFLFLIIFVFDPLALAMLTIYNFIVTKNKIILNNVEYSIPTPANEIIEEDVTPEEISYKEDSIGKFEKILQDKSTSINKSKQTKITNSTNTTPKVKKPNTGVENNEINNSRLLTKEQIKQMSHQNINKILSNK